MKELILLCREALQAETVVSLFIALVAFLVGTGMTLEWRRWKATFKLLESTFQINSNQAAPKITSHLPWLLICLACLFTGLLIGFYW